MPCHARVPLLPDGFSVPRRGRFPGNLHTRRPQHLRAWERGGGAPPSPDPGPRHPPPLGAPWPLPAPGSPEGSVKGRQYPQTGCGVSHRATGQLPVWGPGAGGDTGTLHCRPTADPTEIPSEHPQCTPAADRAAAPLQLPHRPAETLLQLPCGSQPRPQPRAGARGSTEELHTSGVKFVTPCSQPRPPGPPDSRPLKCCSCSHEAPLHTSRPA